MARPRDTSKEDLPKVKITKESIKETLLIYNYLKPYRGTFIAGLVFIALSSGTMMGFPYMLQKLIDSAHGTPKPPFAFSPTTIALIMVALLGVQMIFSFMRIYLFTYVGENTVSDLRQDIYKRLITMPMNFFGQNRVGELSSRISADANQIQEAVTGLLAEFLRGCLIMIMGMAYILFINFKMTLLMLSVVPVIVVIALVFGKYIRKMSRKAQDQLAESNTVVQETLSGIANVKAFSNEWYETGRYRKNISEVVNMSIKNSRFRGLFVSFMLFSVFGAVTLVVWYGAGLMQAGQLSFGDLTAFVVVTAFVGGTMAGFAEIFSQLQKTLGATQRVRELLREQVEDVTVTDTVVEEQYRLRGNVTLEHVKFSYPSRQEIQIIKDLSLNARSGQQIAIVGPSGAGKSTIVSLLLRFYQPDSGRILFDGRDAASIPLSQLRRQMALVPQDIHLFGGTIYENIAYGRPNATLEEVQNAARKANAHEFISRFPEGYNTTVGERGIKLSGGQRQRIAIARAILKDPVILLLDEATSSLDSESEALVQDALQNLMKDRTSFVIAHRLSTIRSADQILVLEDGRVRESGTHHELISIEDGLYRNLNKLQLFEG
ncbi:ABC transporter transmembrane domain-containing protein [Nemorincola caseinilytica]|uniref:ABC transporter transmembrane domain-containing protein n=1 Tax=Nemorincola caseinilytica TaxID=2054315 RepID=A0ABP8N1H9_9BACT